MAEELGEFGPAVLEDFGWKGMDAGESEASNLHFKQADYAADPLTGERADTLRNEAANLGKGRSWQQQQAAELSARNKQRVQGLVGMGMGVGAGYLASYLAMQQQPKMHAGVTGAYGFMGGNAQLQKLENRIG